MLVRKSGRQRKRSTKPAWQIRIAKERIEILFKEAEKRVKKQPELSRRYMKMAKKIGMRYNVRIPKHLKRRYCKYCYSFLKPGVTSKQRTRKGFLIIKCLNCGKEKRYPIK